MLIFRGTEFTDFIDCELISICMVSEDGKHVLYLEEQDFNRSKFKAPVQSNVSATLDRVTEQGFAAQISRRPNYLRFDQATPMVVSPLFPECSPQILHRALCLITSLVAPWTPFPILAVSTRGEDSSGPTLCNRSMTQASVVCPVRSHHR